MSKTANRVLSMVIAAIMLLSMLPTFTVAFAASPFSTAYNGTAYDGVTISKQALLVDSSITQTSGTITRAWEGVDYTFVVGTNAFSTLDAAYAKAKALGIATPDILLFKWDTSTSGNKNLTIDMSARIFGRKWNVAPMNEMNPSFKAVTAGIKDWTANTNFISSVDTIKADDTSSANNLIVGNTIKGVVEVYGVRFFDSMYFAGTSGYRASNSGQIKIKLQNVILQNPPGKDWDNSHIRTIYATDYANNDYLTFKNTWFREIRTGRLFAQTNVPANMTFEGCYFNNNEVGTALTSNGGANFWIKQNTTNGTLTYKSCYFPISRDDKIINLASGLTGTTVAQNTSLKLVFDNNVFNNYGDNQPASLVDVQLDNYTSIDFTNNYAYNTVDANKSIFPSTTARCASMRGTVTVTGNKLLGFGGAYTVSGASAFNAVKADNNFIVKQVLTSEAAYKTVTCTAGVVANKGFTGCTNSFFYDYDMKYNSNGTQVTSNSLGASISEDYKTISYFTTGKSVLVTTNHFTTANTSVGKTLYNDPNCTTEVKEFDTNTVPASSYGITTLYLKTYYKNSLGEEVYPTATRVYRVQFINPEATTFNELLEKGVSMKNGFYSAEDTIVYLPKTNIAKKGDYYYADIHPHSFKFVVDNKTVWANTGADLPNVTGVKNVMFTSGDYGDINLKLGVNYLGANYNYSPHDKSVPNAENNFDWGISSSWSELKSSVFGLMSVPAGVTGTDLMIDGVTFARFEDTLRAETTPLNVTIKNSMIATYKGTTGNANYAIALDNKRATTTNATVAAANKDKFTLMSIRCKSMTSNQLIHERVGPNVLIENVYLDGVASGKRRPILSFFKTNSLVNTKITIIGNNFRNGNQVTGGNSLFLVEGAKQGATNTAVAGNRVSVEINNNIIYNGQGGKQGMFNPDISTIGSYKVTNNIIIEDKGQSMLFAYTNQAGVTAANAAIKGNVVVDKNRIVGIPAANMTNDLGLGADNPKLTNTFYTVDPFAHQRPSAILGNYVAAIGTTLSTDGTTQVENAYFLDYNMTKWSTSYKNAPVFADTLTGGLIIGGNAFNATDSQAYMPKYTAYNTEGYVLLEFGSTIFKFKPDGSKVIANGSTGSLTKSKIVLPSGSYGDVTLPALQATYYGANCGINPNDKSSASAENDFDWNRNSKWDVDDVSTFDYIRIPANASGNITFDGIEIAKGFYDTARTTSVASINVTIRNSLIDAPKPGLVEGVFNLAAARTTNTSMTNNTDKFTLQNVRVERNGANHLIHEHIYPNTVFDGLYWNSGAAGQIRGMLGIHKIYGNSATAPTYTVKNSNLRVTKCEGYATFRFDRPNGVAMTLTDNIFYIDNASSGFLWANTGLANIGVFTMTNNTFIGKASAGMLSMQLNFPAGSKADRNKIIGFTANNVNWYNLQFTNTYYASRQKTYEKPDAITGEYIVAMGSNPYYLDFNMTKFNTSITETFNSALAAGLTINGVTFNTTNTAVYLPPNSTGSEAVLVFAGKAYKFVVDNTNVFSNTGDNMSVLAGFENVILPAGNYGNFNVTSAQKFYGSSFGINPNDKSIACAENNYDWARNEAWDFVNTTKFVSIDINANVEGSDLVFDGISLSKYNDISRNSSAPDLRVTFVNSIVEDANDFYCIFNSYGGRTVNGGYNGDTLTVKDIYVKSMTANQLFHEMNVPTLTIDGIYVDAKASGKGRSIISFFKWNTKFESKKGRVTLTIKNSNFRNGSNANNLIEVNGYATNTTAGWVYEEANAQALINVVIDNNIMYNAQGNNSATMFAFNNDSVGNVTISNNTVIDSYGTAKLADVLTRAHASIEESTANHVKFDGSNNRFVGFTGTKVNIDPRFGGISESFFTSNKTAYLAPEAIVGEYVELMGGNDFWLDYAMTVKNTEVTTSFNERYEMVDKSVTINGQTFGEEEYVIYLPMISVKDGADIYRKIGDTIMRIKPDEFVVFKNNGSDLSSVEKAAKDRGIKNVILLAGDYGELSINAPLNFYGTNANINPNDKSKATGANGFEWQLNSNWDLANASNVKTIRIANSVSAGNLVFNGVTVGMYIDNVRESSNVVNGTIQNSVFVDSGDGNAVIHTDSPHAKFGLGNDTITVKDCYVKSTKSNQFLHEFNVPNVVIDGLYLDGVASGKKRPALSFFKFSSARQNSIVVKNSNFRNGGTVNGANPLFTVSGAIDTKGTADTGDDAYAKTGMVSVSIDNNVMYNAMGSTNGAIFCPYADSVGSFSVTNNTIIDTKGNKLIEVARVYTDVELPNTALNGKITFNQNSLVGLDQANVNFDLGFGTNPVLKNSYYSSSVAGLKDIYANTGSFVKAMGAGNSYYVDVARTMLNTNVSQKYVITVNGVNKSDLAAALETAKSGDVIKLTANIETPEVIVAPGVTVDLNGFTLTAEYVNGFNGSDVVDTSANKTGKLVAQKGSVKLAKDNNQLSIYNEASDYYVFTTIQTNVYGKNRYKYTADANKYTTSPFFFTQGNAKERDLAHSILKTNFATSGVDVKIRITWSDTNNTFVSDQDFKYTVDSVQKYIGTYGTSASSGNEKYDTLYAVFSNAILTQGENVKIYTVVASDTGVEYVSGETTIA